MTEREEMEQLYREVGCPEDQDCSWVIAQIKVFGGTLETERFNALDLLRYLKNLQTGETRTVSQEIARDIALAWNKQVLDQMIAEAENK